MRTTAMEDAKSDDETSSSTTSDDVADGELHLLHQGLEEPCAPLAPDVKQELKRNFSSCLLGDEESYYGHPLSPQEAVARLPTSDTPGHVWNVTIVPDQFIVNGKLTRGLNKRDFDMERRAIKPRRASLPVAKTDFFSSLVKVPGSSKDGSPPRYIFHGVLNGWPALTCLELLSLEQKRHATSIPTPKDLVTGQIVWTHVWQSGLDSNCDPALSDHTRVYRAKLRAAPWSARGWSAASSGFCFWCEALRPAGPRVTFGTQMTEKLGPDKCTYIHMISHRYARVREGPRDRLTYHSVCLLEWEHGDYCTVVESAYLNGMGGYKGKSKCR